ncbi:MAG: hypothetical protein R3266_07940, partial [Gemmatimonadota bacterium]|nr:hypothetical protein [Gemmatimonadota bacterium]
MSDVLTQGRVPARFARAAPADAPELMDAPDCDRSDLAEALDLLGRVARRTGGDRLLLRQVRALLATRAPGPLRLLDVGTGGGHTALALDRALRDRGWAPSFVLADLHARTLDI